MKEKIGQVKTWIKEHKKRSARIAAAIVLILGAAGFGIAGVNNVNANTSADKKISTETVKKDTSENGVKDNSSTKKDADSDKKEDEVDKVKTEDKDATVSDQEAKTDDVNQTANTNASTSGSNSNTSSSGSSGLSNEGGHSHTHSYTIPIYGTDQKWVVDQAAWTETVNEPIYEMVEKSICNGCGLDITGDPWTHIENQMISGNLSCGGYHSKWESVQTGTNTYTVDHPEQGHWESYSVVTGYRCSCGAIK